MSKADRITVALFCVGVIWYTFFGFQSWEGIWNRIRGRDQIIFALTEDEVITSKGLYVTNSDTFISFEGYKYRWEIKASDISSMSIEELEGFMMAVNTSSIMRIVKPAFVDPIWDRILPERFRSDIPTLKLKQEEEK